MVVGAPKTPIETYMWAAGGGRNASVRRGGARVWNDGCRGGLVESRPVEHLVTKPKPIDLADVLRPYGGLWVAVLRGEVVDAAETPGLLSKRLHDREIRDATIVRSPRRDEAELVGLG